MSKTYKNMYRNEEMLATLNFQTPSMTYAAYLFKIDIFNPSNTKGEASNIKNIIKPINRIFLLLIRKFIRKYRKQAQNLKGMSILLNKYNNILVENGST